MTEERYRQYLERRGQEDSLSSMVDAEDAFAAGDAVGASRFWPIRPVPAPRQSQRDRFAPQRRVKRYRDYCGQVKDHGVWKLTPGDLVIFYMPIAKRRRKDNLDGMPHTQVPDVDNLLKALLDAQYQDDAHIWNIQPYKLWHPTGGIYIERRDPVITTPFIPDISLDAGD